MRDSRAVGVGSQVAEKGDGSVGTRSLLAIHEATPDLIQYQDRGYSSFTFSRCFYPKCLTSEVQSKTAKSLKGHAERCHERKFHFLQTIKPDREE